MEEPQAVRTIQPESFLLDWGSWAQDWQIGHRRLFQERKPDINGLELKGAFLDLEVLTKDLHGDFILLEMDNTVAVAAVNRKSSARSPSLQSGEEPVELLQETRHHGPGLAHHRGPKQQSGSVRFLPELDRSRAVCGLPLQFG